MSHDMEWDSSIVPLEDPPVTAVNGDKSKRYRLLSIRIENFKSYKGVFEIGPFPSDNNPMICIVGPNGSGKSNLMDAVAFCFNCADSKKLRGDGLASNLISENCNSASVIVTLDSGTDQISFTRTLMGTRNDSKYILNDKKVSLEIYRQSMQECGLDLKGNFLVFQGDVEALSLSDPASLGMTIDRVSGSSELAKEFTELKERKSELEKEYSVLGQRKKKLVCEKKLLKTEIQEIDKIDKLISQKSKLLNEYFLNKLYLIDLESAVDAQPSGGDSRTVEEIQRDMKDQESLLEKTKTNRAKAEMKQSKVSRRIITEEASLLAVRGRKANVENKLESYQNRLSQIDVKIQTKSQQVSLVKRKIISVDQQVIEQGKLLEHEQDALNRLITNGVVDLDAVTDNDLIFPLLEKSDRGIDRDEIKRMLARFRSLELPLLTGELRDHLTSMKSELGRLDQSIEVVRRRKADVTSQLVKNETTERAVSDKMLELEKVVDSKTRELKKLAKDLDLSSNKKTRLLNRKDKLESEKRSLLDELSDMKESEAEIARERQVREILLELTSKFGGTENVYGRFCDLVTPIDDRYMSAIQTAAGKYLNAVLVKNVSVAKDAVAWLKNEKKGLGLTFVPVNDVVVKVSENRNLGTDQIKRAIDCVTLRDTTAGIHRGIEYILSNTYVCTSMSEARSAAYSPQFRAEGVTVVTVAGEKINANGTITLGGSGSGKFSLRQVNEISGKLELINKELEVVGSELKGIDDEKLSNLVRSKELEIAYETARLEQVKNELKRIGDSISTIGKFIETTNIEEEEQQGKKSQVEELIKKKIDEIRALIVKICREYLLNSFGVDEGNEAVLSAVGGSLNDPTMNVKIQLDQSKQKQRETVARIDASISALENEKRCLELELQESQDFIKQLDQEALAGRKNLSNSERELNTVEKEVAKLEETLQKLREELSELKASKSRIEEETKGIIERLQSLRKEHTIAKAVAIKAEKQIERIKSSKVQVLKEAVMKNAFIPLRLSSEDLMMGSPEDISRQIIEQVFVSLSAVVPFDVSPHDDSVQSLIDEVLSKIDLEGVSEDVKRRGSLAAKKDRVALVLADLEREFSNKIAELESELEQAGAGISRATRNGQDSRMAMERVEEELTSIAKSAEQLKRQLAETGTNLSRIVEERNRRFLDCFNMVSKKVDELYKILTSYDEALGVDGRECVALATTSSTAAATLDLENPVLAGSDLKTIEAFSCGVIFSLMPPFKRYTNIELLSGGEKTVAAVALLFALLTYSAPPFSMVDEIDAALDAENVGVLSRFMKYAVPHQLLVISLKESLYAKADCLIGVYKDCHTSGSGIVTLDLRPYPYEEDDEGCPARTSKSDGPLFTPAPMTERRESRVLIGGA